MFGVMTGTGPVKLAKMYVEQARNIREYINKHKKTAYKQNPELYNIDDALVPNMDDSFGSGVNLKLFDVPAMAFTTSDKQPIDFAYVMYWDKEYN